MKAQPAPRMGWLAIVLVILGCCAPLMAGVFRVWVSQDALHKGYRLSEATLQRQRLTETHKQLQVEVAAARSPQQLRQLASTLGLAAPEPHQVFSRVPDGP